MTRYPGYRVGLPHPNVPGFEWYRLLYRRLLLSRREFWIALWYGRD